MSKWFGWQYNFYRNEGWIIFMSNDQCISHNGTGSCSHRQHSVILYMYQSASHKNAFYEGLWTREAYVCTLNTHTEQLLPLSFSGDVSPYLQYDLITMTHRKAICLVSYQITGEAQGVPKHFWILWNGEGWIDTFSLPRQEREEEIERLSQNNWRAK